MTGRGRRRERARGPGGGAGDAVIPAAFDEADREMITSLESLDDAVNYADWIYSLIQPHLGDRVLEVGAGHGTFTERLRRGRRVTATELSARCVALLGERFAGDSAVEVVSQDFEHMGGLGTFDAAVLINVLEHIADDRRAVQLLRDTLVPGGRLVLYVPAFAALYSDFDRRVGHYRRYGRDELEDVVRSAGLEVVELRFVNSLGVLAWWTAKQLRLVPTKRWSTLAYDRAAVPVLRRVERRFQPPVGQSLLCVGVRREEPDA